MQYFSSVVDKAFPEHRACRFRFFTIISSNSDEQRICCRSHMKQIEPLSRHNQGKASDGSGMLSFLPPTTKVKNYSFLTFYIEWQRDCIRLTISICRVNKNMRTCPKEKLHITEIRSRQSPLMQLLWTKQGGAGTVLPHWQQHTTLELRTWQNVVNITIRQFQYACQTWL